MINRIATYTPDIQPSRNSRNVSLQIMQILETQQDMIDQCFVQFVIAKASCLWSLVPPNPGQPHTRISLVPINPPICLPQVTTTMPILASASDQDSIKRRTIILCIWTASTQKTNLRFFDRILWYIRLSVQRYQTIIKTLIINTHGISKHNTIKQSSLRSL